MVQLMYMITCAVNLPPSVFNIDLSFLFRFIVRSPGFLVFCPVMTVVDMNTCPCNIQRFLKL